MSGAHWTQEQRQRQREAIARWKPWERSTGPRSLEGKAKAAANSRRHGLYDAKMRAEMAHFRELLREHLEILELLEEARDAGHTPG